MFVEEPLHWSIPTWLRGWSYPILNFPLCLAWATYRTHTHTHTHVHTQLLVVTFAEASNWVVLHRTMLYLIPFTLAMTDQEKALCVPYLSHRITLHRNTSRSHHNTSHRITSHHTTIHHNSSQDIKSHHITSHHMTTDYNRSMLKI